MVTFLSGYDDTSIMNKLTSSSSSNVPVSGFALSKTSEKTLVKNESLPSESSIRSNATFSWSTQINQSTITTGFYVLAALSTIIVLYFVFRAIRLRRRNYKVRRYGVIASREDVEMTPLENEDDDEDSTVFDISMKNNCKS